MKITKVDDSVSLTDGPLKRCIQCIKNKQCFLVEHTAIWNTGPNTPGLALMAIWILTSAAVLHDCWLVGNYNKWFGSLYCLWSLQNPQEHRRHKNNISVKRKHDVAFRCCFQRLQPIPRKRHGNWWPVHLFIDGCRWPHLHCFISWRESSAPQTESIKSHLQNIYFLNNVTEVLLLEKQSLFTEKKQKTRKKISKHLGGKKHSFVGEGGAIATVTCCKMTVVVIPNVLRWWPWMRHFEQREEEDEDEDGV